MFEVSWLALKAGEPALKSCAQSGFGGEIAPLGGFAVAT